MKKLNLVLNKKTVEILGNREIHGGTKTIVVDPEPTMDQGIYCLSLLGVESVCNCTNEKFICVATVRQSFCGPCEISVNIDCVTPPRPPQKD